MRVLQYMRHRIKLFFGLFMAWGISGFIIVLVGIININTANIVMAMIMLSIAAVVLGSIIAMAIIVGISISLLNNSLERVAKDNLAKESPTGEKTKQPMRPTPQSEHASILHDFKYILHNLLVNALPAKCLYAQNELKEYL